MKKITRSRRKYLWRKQRRLAAKIWRLNPVYSKSKIRLLESEVSGIRYELQIGYEV